MKLERRHYLAPFKQFWENPFPRHVLQNDIFIDFIATYLFYSQGSNLVDHTSNWPDVMKDKSTSTYYKEDISFLPYQLQFQEIIALSTTFSRYICKELLINQTV